MRVEFNKDYLRELYEEGKCKNKKYQFQPQIVLKYQRRIDTLISATRKEDLFPFRSLNFEALHGDKEGLFSIRVDSRYRLEFSIREATAESVIAIACIIDLSNHYS